MSRAVTIILQDRTWGALAAEAHQAGADFPTYLARILNARIAEQDAADQAKRQAVARSRAEGVPVLSAKRRPAVLRSHLAGTTAAIDAAIERTGDALRRHNGSLTARVMGDPEPGRPR